MIDAGASLARYGEWLLKRHGASVDAAQHLDVSTWTAEEVSSNMEQFKHYLSWDCKLIRTNPVTQRYLTAREKRPGLLREEDVEERNKLITTTLTGRSISNILVGLDIAVCQSPTSQLHALLI